MKPKRHRGLYFGLLSYSLLTLTLCLTPALCTATAIDPHLHGNNLSSKCEESLPAKQTIGEPSQEHKHTRFKKNALFNPDYSTGYAENHEIFKRKTLLGDKNLDTHDDTDAVFGLYANQNPIIISDGLNLEKEIYRRYVDSEPMQADESEIDYSVDKNIYNSSINATVVPASDVDVNIRNEGDDAKIIGEAFSTTTSNYTMEEECVGDPDYCNYTREEYIALLHDYIFPQPYEWVLIASHSVVFFVGLVGNALVCIAVYRNHSMRTVTNYFIVNLAVADFMVILICLPPTVLWDVTETWFFGNVMCRVVLYFQSVSVTVSVLTLTFISVDRWYAICFPLKFKSTTGRAKTAIFVIWLLSLLFNMPEFVMLQVMKSSKIRFQLDYLTQCAPTWSMESDLKWHIVKLVFLYSLPLLLMTIAYCQIVRVLWKSDNIPGHCESHKYSTNANTQTNWMTSNRRNTMSAHANASTEGQLRSRRKAAKMLVAVVVMFAVCYFPVHLIAVLRYAFNMEQTDVMIFLALLSHWLCYANSAVNPLIYNFMSGKFRREFRRSFFKCSCLGLGPVRGAEPGQSAQGNRNAAARASYRLAHLSPSTCRSRERDFGRSQTSFIENNNRKPRADSVGDNPATRLTLATDPDSRPQ